MLQDSVSNRDVSTNEQPKKNDQVVLDNPTRKENDYASVIRDGVEVVDVKVVPKDEKITLDKFGIPIKGPRKTWDKI